MRIKSARWISLALVALFLTGACFTSADAQTRRRKRSRRVTNPIVRNAPANSSAQSGATQQPGANDPQIISTAEDQLNETTGEGGASATGAGARRAGRSRASNGATDAEQDSMRRTVNRLSTQVTQLTDKLGQMEEQQRTLVNLERLSRAEQRAESLRAELRDVQAKEADLQARLEQLDYALLPENLDNSMAAFGSTRPEQLREQRRRQLESERSRVRTQLDQLANGRTRLEAAIVTAESEADRIRQLMDASNNGVPTVNNTNTTGTTTTTTTDTGTTNSNSPVTDRPSAPPATTSPSGNPPLR